MTAFYLGHDPLVPGRKASYRRNLLYIREARWHLGILMGKVDVADVDDFKRSLTHHDLIMKALREIPRPEKGKPPVLTPMECAAIVLEGLD